VNLWKKIDELQFWYKNLLAANTHGQTKKINLCKMPASTLACKFVSVCLYPRSHTEELWCKH